MIIISKIVSFRAKAGIFSKQALAFFSSGKLTAELTIRCFLLPDYWFSCLKDFRFFGQHRE